MKKLEIKLAQIGPIIDSLNSFVQVKMPAKYSWRLTAAVKKLQGEINGFNQFRDDLYKKYGKELTKKQKKERNMDENAVAYEVIPAKKEEFTKEFSDFLQETIVLEFEPIPLSIISETDISISDLSNLEEFIFDDLSETVSA